MLVFAFYRNSASLAISVGVSQLSTYVMIFFLKLMVASEASRRSYQDRQTGAWELLLVTPLSLDEILDGSRRALGEQFRKTLWFLTVVVLVNTLLMTGLVGQVPGSSAQGVWLPIVMAIGQTILLWRDFEALAWVGMWRGLNAKQHRGAILETYGQVIAARWLGGIMLLPFVTRILTSPHLLQVAWIGGFVLLDRVLEEVAKRNLRDHFRAVLQRRGTVGA